VFFRKNDKKRSHPFAILTVGALATVGAMSLISGCKCKMKDCLKKMGGMMMKKKDCPNECE